MYSELAHFNAFLKVYIKEEFFPMISKYDILLLIVNNSVQELFANVPFVLKLYLYMFVTHTGKEGVLFQSLS